MPVVQVRIVRMLVAQGFVAVPMRMRLAGRVARAVGVLVVFVVDVPMLVVRRLVDVLVLVPLR